jgi:predicted nucleic acid-binding protein
VRVLVDTSALVALFRTNDQYHRRAAVLLDRQLATGGGFVGTTLVLSEFYSNLLYTRSREEARQALSRLLQDPVHDWQAVDTKVIQDAVTNWLVRFSDQSFSLVDAVSFEIMRRGKITHAFAFDHYFEVAGYQLLR